MTGVEENKDFSPEAVPASEDALNREELFKKLRDLQKPISLMELASILNTTVRHDETNKVISFMTMLLTYTDADQLNLSFTAESSTGKSYIPGELGWYFPHEDVIEYCYVSPTAFYHEYGQLVSDPNDTREVEEEKKHKIIYINLHQKILIFLDQPHDILLQRLTPLLSHDRKVLMSKITNRNTNRTESIQIEGYPTVLFCTAKFSMEDQERTRLLLLSPDVSQEKLKDSVLLKLQKESDRDSFNKYMESDPHRLWLAHHVEAVKDAHIRNVIIPEELRNKIAKLFFESHKHLIPRHMRDFGRLMGLIKACSILNLWQKQRIEENLIADEIDIENGFKLYSRISVANELGLPPEVFKIFMAIKDQFSAKGATKTEVCKLYYEAFHRTIGKKRIEEVLNLLLSVGLLNEEQNEHDRREKLYTVTGQGVYISETETTLENYAKPNSKLYTPSHVSSGEDKGLTVNSPVSDHTGNGIGVDTGPTSHVEEHIVCGHCQKWHTGACSFPGDPNAITPLNTHAKTCGEYHEQEPKKDDGLAKAAAAVLNGTSGRLTKDE